MEPEYGATVESLRADLVGRELRIYSQLRDVCVTEITGVNAFEPSILDVQLLADLDVGCNGSASCVHLDQEIDVGLLTIVRLHSQMMGYPDLVIKRGKKARARGPQCP